MIFLSHTAMEHIFILRFPHNRELEFISNEEKSDQMQRKVILSYFFFIPLNSS